MSYHVAVVGATGLVGETIIELLAERDFPVSEISLLASERSAGKTIVVRDKSVVVQDLATFDFNGVDYAFFSAGGDVSVQYAPIAAAQGAVVIDNTSAFRYEPDIPLVVPEVNSYVLKDFKGGGIIANPNCSTIQMVVVLKPIYDLFGIERVNVATYQSVSGAGRRAIEGLAKETADLLNGQPVESSVFPTQIAFNAIPHIDVFQDNGYTREEMKMVWETQKILADETVRVNPTAVRVPVFFGHSEAIHIETRDPVDLEAVREALENMVGVVLVNDDNQYPTAISHAANHDGVFVGRLRKDISHEKGINCWVVADNVRKGAALNAIQIAEVLCHDAYYKH